MADCSVEHESQPAAGLVESACRRLEPRLHQVIEALAEGGDTGSFFATGAFVQDLLKRLRKTESESDLLLLLLDISVIGFQGFELTPQAKAGIDSLLAESEAIASALKPGEPLH